MPLDASKVPETRTRKTVLKAGKTGAIEILVTKYVTAGSVTKYILLSSDITLSTKCY